MGTIITILLLIVLAYLVYTKYFKQRDFMSFRESLALVELPIVTFRQGDKKLNFILDTGANRSIINKDDEATIISEDTGLNSKVLGIEGSVSHVSLKNIKFTYKNKEFEDTFQVLDISKTVNAYKAKKGVIIHGLIGNGFMQKYKYVLDFKEMVAYSKR